MKNNQTNKAVAHDFIYGVDSRSGTMRTKVYKDITILYSYNSILAIKYKKENIIIISKDISSYSNTSQKHHNCLLTAINTEQIIYINTISTHLKGLKSLLNNDTLSYKIEIYIDLLKKQKKARKKDYSYIINTTITELKLIVNYGKIDKRNKYYKIYMDIIYNTNLDELLEKAIIAEKKNNARIAEKNYKRNLEKLEYFTGVSLKHYSKSDVNNFQFLKITGDEILTSGHAKGTTKEITLLYKMLLSGKKIIGSKIGNYTILAHNAKSVKIGCHNILLSEIKRVLNV